MLNSLKVWLCLLVLSFLMIFLVSFFMPLIPFEFCVGSAFSAIPVSAGYSNYFEYAYSFFSKEDKALVSNTEENVEVKPDVKIEESYVSVPQTSDIPISNETEYVIDTKSILDNYTPPVRKENEPQILIVHTHATEGYADSDNRSLDAQKNMVAVGKALCDSLTEYGFSVIHDTTYHDYPNYNGSYSNSLKTVNSYLEKYPSIDIVLDLHRDGIIKEDGTKVKLATDYNGEKAAQLMFVVGTDSCGLNHPYWKDNLAFAIGLQTAVNNIAGSVMRPINLRCERFNQHTTRQSIIVECGTNGNELKEAILSVKLLAQAINIYIPKKGIE